METELDPQYVRRLVEAALAEDRADRDITTEALVPRGQAGRAELIAKEQGVLAGLAFAREAFAAVRAEFRLDEDAAGGGRPQPGAGGARGEGSLGSHLRGRRVDLSLL